MPDWKKFADLLGMAQFGDDVRAAKERKRKENIESEELGFRRDANTRAGAAEGRAAETNQYEKSQRPVFEEQLRQKVKMGELSIKEAQNQLDTFNATGGAGGVAARQSAEEQRKANEDKRSGARLGLAQGQDKRETEAQGERLRGAKLSNDFEEATLPARIEERNDPLVKDSQLLANLAQAYNSAIRSGDKEGSQQIWGDYISLRSELQKKKAIAATKREAVERVKGPVKGSPYDIFK